MQVSQRSAHTGEQPDQAGKQLVVVQRGPQQHHHACKGAQHGDEQRPLTLHLALLVQNGTAHDERTYPDAAHVVQGHGGGQR